MLATGTSLSWQGALNTLRPLAGVQSRQDVEDVFGAEHAGLDDQFDGHQHRLQAVAGYAIEHLRHDLVTPVMTHQP